MAQHKWHKEIKAWADGAEIESLCADDTEWQEDFLPNWDDDDFKFRIKPQPKEPQYLYAYQNVDGNCVISIFSDKYNGQKPIGKIKLETDDVGAT
jgi:hypothetical protein